MVKIFGEKKTLKRGFLKLKGLFLGGQGFPGLLTNVLTPQKKQLKKNQQNSKKKSINRMGVFFKGFVF